MFIMKKVYCVGILNQLSNLTKELTGKALVIYKKVQLCILYNNKYMIASKQITNAQILAFIIVLVFNLLSRKVLFINKKDNRNC